MSLTFKEETHEYFWNGERVPGVSEILKTVGLSRDYAGVDAYYRDRGAAVHKALELSISGMLDEDSMDPIIVPYFEGALKFLGTLKTMPVAIEKKYYSEDYGYAGCVDMETEDLIVDWKCSKSHDRVAELQGEAYKTLVGPPFKSFWVVQLPGDGSFKIFDYGNGIDVWPSVMNLYRWKSCKK